MGETACLLAAATWALAVAFFHQPIARHGAWTVNLGKNVLGTALLGLTALALGQAGDLMGTSTEALAWLAASGIFGLTLGDTALFAAVSRLGPHRSLLFLTLGPVFAGFLAWLFFGERQGPAQLAGSALVLLGVAAVVWRPSTERTDDSASGNGWPLGGIVFALLAAFGLGSGIVFAKGGMEDVPLVAASFVRMAASVASLAAVMAIMRRLNPAVALLGNRRAMIRLAGPAFLGTYVSFLLMMAGIAWAPASVAAVLLATPPIFSLFVDAWWFDAPITGRGLAGTLLSVVGVGVLSLAG
ncbi:MAG: DMT family transporter [Thermoanaerobaculia bacterium]|nr:DMT family transporter [Thermoanaerobaculia bacterium]